MMKAVKISINFGKFTKFYPFQFGKPCFDMQVAISEVRLLKIPNVQLKQKNRYGSVSSWDNF